MNAEKRRPLSSPFSRFRGRDQIAVLVFSPANLNAIDGSSVWTQTVTLALADVPNVQVSILLAHRLTTDRLAGPLLRNPNVDVIDPFKGWRHGRDASLSIDNAAGVLVGMSSKVDVVIVRGADLASRLAREPKLQGKLWPYLTDVPQRAEDIDDMWRARIADIMQAAPILLCQTDELRSFLESSFQPVADKGRLLPPIVPGDVEPKILPAATSAELRLCYSGKFARQWNTYEMCEIPAQMAERGIRATLTMVGDKINRDPEWPGYVDAMRERLESSEGVVWVGGVSRSESIEHMAHAHLGLSWRSKELDDSLELSTKLLEYCAAGTPPILNRTAMHERVFGKDYPFFADDDTIVPLLESAITEPWLYGSALKRLSSIPGGFTLDKATERLTALLADRSRALNSGREMSRRQSHR